METGLVIRIREWLVGSGPIESAMPEAHLSLAALLVEMMRADFEDQGAEREAATRVLARSCGLDREEAEALLNRGEHAADRSVSLYEHTRTLDNVLSEEEKFEVIEALWEVAFADGELDGQEDFLAHRLADLLHVRHSDLMRIKDQVLSRM